MNWTFERGDRVVSVGSPPRAGVIVRRYSIEEKFRGWSWPEVYDVLFDGDKIPQTAFKPRFLMREPEPGEKADDAPDGPDHT